MFDFFNKNYFEKKFMKEEKNTFQKYFKKSYEKKKIHHFLAFPTFLKFFGYIRLQSSSNQKIQYMKYFVISPITIMYISFKKKYYL